MSASMRVQCGPGEHAAQVEHSDARQRAGGESADRHDRHRARSRPSPVPPDGPGRRGPIGPCRDRSQLRHTAAMNSPLAGQLALITGGGSGIGLACARALLADGADVVLAARNVDRLAAVGRRAARRVPRCRDRTVACDVTDEASVEAACAAAAAAGPLRIVVANAGTGSAGPFHLTTLDDWNTVLSTNLTGAFLTMKHAVPYLAANGGGSIVAMSSIAAVATHRYMTPYNVSKAGLEMLVRQVADELGSLGHPRQRRATEPGADRHLRRSHRRPRDRRRLPRTDAAAPARHHRRHRRRRSGSWPAPRARGSPGVCISADGGHHLRRGPNLDGGDARWCSATPSPRRARPAESIHPMWMATLALSVQKLWRTNRPRPQRSATAHDMTDTSTARSTSSCSSSPEATISRRPPPRSSTSSSGASSACTTSSPSEGRRRNVLVARTRRARRRGRLHLPALARACSVTTTCRRPPTRCCRARPACC